MAQHVGGSADCHMMLMKREIRCDAKQKLSTHNAAFLKHETHLAHVRRVRLPHFSREIVKHLGGKISDETHEDTVTRCTGDAQMPVSMRSRTERVECCNIF